MTAYATRIAHSDYGTDDLHLGLTSGWGRGVTIVDTVSQIGKSIVGTAGTAGYSVYHLGKGSLELAGAAGSAVVWGLSKAAGSKPYIQTWEGRAKKFWTNGGADFSSGVCAIVGAILSVLWKICVVIANILGILVPEIGRKARTLDKAINTALTVFCQNQEAPKPDAEAVKDRKGVQHGHDWKMPQAVLIGEFLRAKGTEWYLGADKVQMPTVAKVKEAIYVIYSAHMAPDSHENVALKTYRCAQAYAGQPQSANDIARAVYSARAS